MVCGFGDGRGGMAQLCLYVAYMFRSNLRTLTNCFRSATSADSVVHPYIQYVPASPQEACAVLTGGQTSRSRKVRQVPSLAGTL